jgi:hypothetical protein
MKSRQNKIISFTLIILFLLTINSFADIPEIIEYKVNRIRGIVEYKYEFYSEEEHDYISGTKPLENATIEIRRYNDDDVIVATSTTDEKGYFEINNVEKGKYWLYAIFEPFTKQPLVINFSKGFRNKGKILKITLGPGIMHLGKSELIDDIEKR